MDDFEEKNKFGSKAKILQKFQYLKKNILKYFCLFICFRTFYDFFYLRKKLAFLSGGGGRPPPHPLRMQDFFTCSLSLEIQQ